jgi:hypothetical protein
MTTKSTKADKPETLRDATKRLRTVEGERAFHLDLFGDFLAEREGYNEHTGLDALYYYLIQKHHWLPSQVRSLNQSDLYLLFDEEMSGWTVPKEHRGE